MKIWTKRTAAIGAILGGLLVAGTIAASASDLPLLGGAASSVPAVSRTQTTPASSVASTAQRTASSKAAANRTSDNAKADKTAGSTAAGGSGGSVNGIGNRNNVDVDLDGVSLKDVADVCGIVVDIAGSGGQGTCPPQGSSSTPGGGGGGGDDPEQRSSSSSVNGILNENTVSAEVGKITAEDVLDACGIDVVVAAGGDSTDCPK